jgi:hypothetical protein
MSTTPSIATRYTARYGVRHPAKGEYPIHRPYHPHGAREALGWRDRA